MHILLTGACGRIGTHTLSHLLESGHTVLATDVVALPSTLPTTAAGFTPSLPHPSLTFLKGDLTDLSFVDSLFKDKFDGVIHLGAIPNPRDDLDDRKLHAINVCSSYNILRTSTDHNIKRLVQASSVNAHGLSFSPEGHTSFSHFPIDEDVEKKPEDAYAISKAECELQATAICRWAPGTRVASLRFHMVRETYETAWPDCTSTDIFSWVSYESCARACVLALTKGDWAGHEVFNIVAPETCWEGGVERQRKKGEEGGERAGTVELLRRYWPDGEIDEEYFGKNARAAAWTSAKAERVLGWSHDPPKTK